MCMDGRRRRQRRHQQRVEEKSNPGNNGEGQGGWDRGQTAATPARHCATIDGGRFNPPLPNALLNPPQAAAFVCGGVVGIVRWVWGGCGCIFAEP